MISDKDIALLLNLNENYLYNLASRMDRMVHRRKKLKRNGEYRFITSPNNELKDVLSLINNKVLGQFHLHAFLFLKPGYNHVKMLSQFRYVKFLLTADVDNFYPSIYPAMVTKTLLNLEFDDSSAKLLTRLMTSHFELPQGFPTSPKIAALSLNPVLLRLDRLAHKEKFLIGLYADNLVIGTRYSLHKFQNIFIKIFRQSGFLLEEFNFYCGNSPREVMGIKILPKLEVKRTYIDDVKKEIITYKKNLGQKRKIKSINGKINYIAYVNSHQADELKKMINK